MIVSKPNPRVLAYLQKNFPRGVYLDKTYEPPVVEGMHAFTIRKNIKALAVKLNKEPDEAERMKLAKQILDLQKELKTLNASAASPNNRRKRKDGNDVHTERNAYSDVMVW